MPVEEEVDAIYRKRNVLVDIRINSHSRELLNWALVKVAEPGDCVVAVHVCPSSVQTSKNKHLLDGYLDVYQGLCSVIKVNVTGKILTGRKVRKVLVTEAYKYDAKAVVVGISKKTAFGGCASMAKYCARRLPSNTDVLAIHNGKIVFRRCNNSQPPGLKGDPRPSFHLVSNLNFRDFHSEFGDSEVGSEISSFEVSRDSKDESRHSSLDSKDDSKDDMLNLVSERRHLSLRYSAPFAEDILEQKPGWPLLRRASSASPKGLHARRMSVVQWVLGLPNRSPQQSPRFLSIAEDPVESETSEIVDESTQNSSSALGELRKGFEILLKTSSSGCKWFSYKVLKAATSQFSSENLIGNGGCNRVYKGILADGKPVAVKILKSSKEAWKDFAHEVDVISSLNHKHITPLLGVCIEDNELISVYDLFSRGSLEENLHGKNKEKSALSWEVRYNVAIGIAEALNYLHNESSRPVIHRDVKSSNILFSDEFEPQLSDFGLAIWGPTNSSFFTEGNVVGTFGYLAPEYFMYGKVSDKIDVYAFGVVLLELLSGRKPIGSDAPKDQESLVMWAKPLIENGDVRGLLDPNLDGNFNEDQMQRMVLAATLCITRAARLRPKIIQILKLLRGDHDIEKWVNSWNKDSQNQDDNDDEVYPNSSPEVHMGLAMLDVFEGDYTSFSSVEQTNTISFEEYLRQRWSRSSSFS
ncbi:Pkinase domain-containing protein/Usp domain-containing protein [Cephalotus follicularis]|uniref:Pkinase domain-containing protein/Usp domain-containing protein n=1 Tax=Cephalotus follicularis TaxID=3775 RepID=A0A1Q3CQR5_CEPFO|nr:Pkinase domain-containing protein/Usp domain-containing protein [Cephalotus follicularis]